MKKTRLTMFIAIALVISLAFPMAAFAAIGVPGTALPGSGNYGDTFSGGRGVYTSWVASSNAFKVADSQYTITMQEVPGTAYERVAKVTNLPLSIANTLGPLDTDEKRANYWQFSTVGDNAISNGDTLMWIRHAAVRNLDTQSWDYIDVKISLRSHDNGASGNNTVAIKKDVRTSVEILNMQEAFLQWDFYYEGTSNKYVYKSNVTFSDIDVDQYLGVRSSDVNKVFADKDTRLKYNELTSSGDANYHMFAGTVVTVDANEEDAIGYLVETDSLRMVFGRASGAGHAHFGYYKYSMIPADGNPPTISKEVTDPDEDGVIENTLSDKSEHFRYRIETTVPSGMYRGYSEYNIIDQIDSCLVVDRVRVTHQSGSSEDCEWTKDGGADTSGADKWFNISVSSNKVTVSAKKSALSIEGNTAFYGGANRESRSVAVTVYVHIDPAIALTQIVSHGHQIKPEQLQFRNRAQIDVGGNPEDSNWVNTLVPIPNPPQPPTKTVSDSDEADVNDNRLKHKTDGFIYSVAQKIPNALSDPTFYKGFSFTDQIDSCLKIEGVTITQTGKGDRTGWFDVTVEGNNVVATAKASALKHDDFCGGDTEFVMNAAVRIDPEKEDAMKTHGGGHYNADGDLLTFYNNASTIITNFLGVYDQKTNDVRTRVAIPIKRVSDSDEDRTLSDRIINANEPFIYHVRQAVLDGMDGAARRYVSFTLTDDLDSCVKVAGARVVRDDGSDVSSLFDIAVSGIRVTASAKAASLTDPSFYGGGNGAAYTLLITAALDQSKTYAELKAHGHYNGAENEMTFYNEAVATIEDSPMTTNKVNTKVGVPDLSITKAVSRYEHQVNDRVKYTITIRHTDKSTSDATSVVVRDVSLPAGFDVDHASLKVSGVATNNFTFETVQGGFVFKSDLIAKNETAIITYDAIPDKRSNGKIVDNTASVTAYSMIQEKRASASVYINSPKLNILKETHKAEYKVGDTISYKLTLTQTNPGTFMRDVIITDSITHGGVTLLPGSVQIMNSENKIITHLCDITVSGNAFTVLTHLNMGYQDRTVPPKDKGIAPYSSLAFENRIIVTYDVAVQSPELSGMSVVNTAISPTRPNTYNDLIKDDPAIPSGGDEEEHRTPIVGAKLKIEKSSDKEIYEIYDTARYTLKVTQLREDYTAKNVVVRDALDTTLAAIVDGSVKVTLNKKDITSGSSITVSGAALEAKTNKDLAWGDTLIVKYDVSFLPETEGAVIVNTAFAHADNADETQDENTVGIEPGKSELAITKESDKTEYLSTETAIYTITTTCISSAPAIGVVIADKLDTTAAAISEGSIKVLLDGEDITSGCAIRASLQDFRIETGKALREGESIVVTYYVNFDETYAGGLVNNTAVAFAGNAGDVQDDNTIEVKPGKAALDIVKESDKTEYTATETAIYTLTATCVSSAPAIGVSITDKLDSAAAVIGEGSIKVMLGSVDITSNCDIMATSQGFRIETGRTLAEGESIVVTYSVTFDPEYEGGAVKNTAVASASNSDDASDEGEVNVTQPFEEDEATPPAIDDTEPTEADTPDSGEDFGSPKTGDGFNPVAVIVLIIGLAGIAGSFIYRRKHLGK